MPESQYKFAEFQLDCTIFELRRQGPAHKSDRISLERIPMELLILLLERRGSVVTRQEIVDRLWGKDVFVDTEHGINTAIRKVRQALKDDPDNPRFIHTVSGKGYRFVTEKHGDATHAAAVPPETPQSTTATKSQPLPPVDTVLQNPAEGPTVDAAESRTGTVPSNDVKNGPNWNHITLTTMIVIN
jgi:DNA-binding winged helix-turn-helix (wHTH) protein